MIHFQRMVLKKASGFNNFYGQTDKKFIVSDHHSVLWGEVKIQGILWSWKQ